MIKAVAASAVIRVEIEVVVEDDKTALQIIIECSCPVAIPNRGDCAAGVELEQRGDAREIGREIGAAGKVDKPVELAGVDERLALIFKRRQRPIRVQFEQRVA